MASAARNAALSKIPPADLQSFSEYLKSCRRIMALLGAGLSASSGLPTFRGAGGLWRSFDATSLATPEAFQRDPGLVWQFYSYRRHMSLHAEPNKAHYALAELSRKNNDFLTLSQNVDENDFTDPIVPALEIPLKESALQKAFGHNKPSKEDELDISDEANPIPELTPAELPHCPKCDGLLRPGVVWFGENLPSDTLNAVDRWIEEAPIDLILVIGTSSRVWPAAGYVDTARKHGARVAVINMDAGDIPGVNGLAEDDWFFQGDASVIVPEILKSVIGEI
ncbi:SIR2 family histone deacetylase [Penicillium chermesinum]|uniref:SIR2 family histone deacetylase n=1 Tax=Penicillium chermesinum TaxID=63820 RepID=A0A9W9TKI1_9EURO|nr:SIR2 family histone deacetylase [Penicillium chermesinum]KAJ5226053.1 SIR2 family histone deacetylase [Penicillium chermesinum]